MLFGRHVNRYYLKYIYLFIAGIITLLVVDYVQLEIPVIYRKVLTAINSGFIDEAHSVAFTADVFTKEVFLPLIVIIAIMLVGRFLWRLCFFGAGEGTIDGLRREMFDNARTLSQRFYSKNKVGGLMSLFTNDLATIEECMGWGVLMFFDATFLGTLATVRMFSVQPVLALFCMIPMALLAVIGAIINKYMMLRWEVKEQAFSDISDYTQESFVGLTVIKAFVRQAHRAMNFKKLNVENERANVAFTRLSVLLKVTVTLFVESVIGVILGVGGYLVHEGGFSAEALIEFLGYFSSVVWPIMAISELVDMTARGRASLKRVSALIDDKTKLVDRSGAKDAGRLSGEIEIKNLTFSYPDGGRVILNDVSFKINAGESVGVVGRIGAGKTTLVDLLTRTYDVPDGTIFVDKTDVNALTIRSVRDNIAYVPQDNFLFSDTIKNNIAFSVGDATDEAVVAAAKLSCVHDEIAGFEKGYDTVLGERGVTVSGGQKQRISIARAVIKDAPVMILDDSLSAVDAETEKILLHNIFSARKGKTTILIAHRISTVRSLDKILFLSGGKVVGFDSHLNLLASCPEYARLSRLQDLEKGGALL